MATVSGSCFFTGSTRPTLGLSRIIAAQCSNSSVNPLRLQDLYPATSHLPYNLNCNKFNHHERLNGPQLCLSSDRCKNTFPCCDAQWLLHSTCSRKYAVWKYSLQFISTLGLNISLSLPEESGLSQHFNKNLIYKRQRGTLPSPNGTHSSDGLGRSEIFTNLTG